MLIVALLVLGFGGIVAQTLLLREMLILFSGNELTLSLVISSWVVSEALGAFIAGLWAERKVVNTKDIYMGNTPLLGRVSHEHICYPRL